MNDINDYYQETKSKSKTADKFGISVPTLNRHLRVYNSLPAEILQLLNEKKISFSLADEFVYIAHKVNLLDLYNKIKSYKNNIRVEIAHALWRNHCFDDIDVASEEFILRHVNLVLRRHNIE
jgi:hypothetical protein